MHRIYLLKILCGDKVKGMTVACNDALSYDDMLADMVGKFGLERVVSLSAK